MNILVLCGGCSSERDVSLSTGRALADALEARGHDVHVVDPWGEGRTGVALVESLLGQITRVAPAVVFVALHGGDGEDGTIQALLDLANVPYTGSGVRASAFAMDKDASKRIVEHEGVPTPPWRVLDGDARAAEDAANAIGYPLVVKPNAGGSTIGLTVLQTPEGLEAAIQEAFAHDVRVLVERYVPGRELTVAILDGHAFPVVEIIPKSGLYDYESKYTAGRTEYVVPAQVNGALATALSTLASTAYRALGCEGMARVDFRVSPEGEPFFLEVNTVPGMTATSLVPKAAAAEGIAFGELAERLCRLAISRTRVH